MADGISSIVKKHQWLTSLLAANDFAAAELLISRMGTAFEQIFALTELANAYHRQGEKEKARQCLDRALGLWRSQSWNSSCLMLIGCVLRSLCECGRAIEAEQLLPEMIQLVREESKKWMQIHGWCGLAAGAIRLEEPGLAKAFFAEAVKVAESRGSEELRASGWMVIQINLEASGWGADAIQKV